MGDRGPAIGFKNHLDALHSDERFEVRVLTSKRYYPAYEWADVLWFYAHPVSKEDVEFVKLNFPEKKLVFGPNIFFDKGELGPSTDFERWFASKLKGDVHFSAGGYYSTHVSKFLNFKKFSCLPYCMMVSEREPKKFSERPIDLLIYEKPRRGDVKFDSALYKIKNGVIGGLTASKKVEILQYGNHDRDTYLSFAEKSKMILWMSREDYCSLAQLEAYNCGTPVIGTPWSLTIPVSPACHIHGMQDFHQWVEWQDDMTGPCEQIIKLVNEADRFEGLPRYYLKENHSFKKYADNVWGVLSE